MMVQASAAFALTLLSIISELLLPRAKAQAAQPDARRGGCLGKASKGRF